MRAVPVGRESGSARRARPRARGRGLGEAGQGGRGRGGRGGGGRGRGGGGGARRGRGGGGGRRATWIARRAGPPQAAGRASGGDARALPGSAADEAAEALGDALDELRVARAPVARVA